MKKRFQEGYSFSSAETIPLMSRELEASWDFGRRRDLPLWPEFVTYSHCPPRWYYTHHNPQLHCFEIPVSGELRLTHQDRTFPIRPGEIYLLPLGEYNRLAIDENGYCNKWSIGFCGNLLTPLLTSLLREHHHFFVRNPERFVSLVQEICHELHEKRSAAVPRLAAMSLQFLMELASCVPAGISPLLAEAVRILEFNFATPIRIRQVAEELNVSESRLSSQFREHFGLSPKHYLTRLRQRQAERLLLNSSLSIKEISQRTGYSAPQYFIREFRKERGCPPGVWRRRQNKQTAAVEKE